MKKLGAVHTRTKICPLCITNTTYYCSSFRLRLWGLDTLRYVFAIYPKIHDESAHPDIEEGGQVGEEIGPRALYDRKDAEH